MSVSANLNSNDFDRSAINPELEEYSVPNIVAFDAALNSKKSPCIAGNAATRTASDQPNKKPSKYFNGCFTCRKRKMSCDGAKPGCHRCSDSGITCDGYEIKLRWRKSIKFNTYGEIILNPKNSKLLDSNNEEPTFHRRKIKYLHYKEEYQYYDEMDNELTKLNKVLKENKEAIMDNKTLIIKKFGVFWGKFDMRSKFMSKFEKKVRKVNKNRPTADVGKRVAKPGWGANGKIKNQVRKQMLNNAQSPMSNLLDENMMLGFNFDSPVGTEWISEELRDDAIISAQAAVTAQHMNGSVSFSNISQPDAVILPNYSAQTPGLSPAIASVATPSTNPNIFGSSQVVQALNEESKFQQNSGSENIFSVLFHQANDTNGPLGSSTGKSAAPFDPLKASVSMESSLPSELMQVVPTEIPAEILAELSQHSEYADLEFLKYVPANGLLCNGLLRFLLNYYSENLVDLMTVVPIPNNPWRKIYFPRALKALGDLSGLGRTTNSRNCLLNAILAISCFNIQNKFPKDSNTKTFFLQLGIKLRAESVTFLEKCLNHTASQEKYKDILTAILSMNTIDIFWGTMADCHRHLSICEGIVLKRMQSRPKISEKAKTIHKIFSFLNLVQNSTALENITADEITILDDTKTTPDVVSPKIDTNTKFENMNQLNPQDNQIMKAYSTHYDGDSPASTPQTPLFQDYQTSLYTKRESNNYDVDDLYGLPNSLILLFSDCVKLVRHKLYYDRNNIKTPRPFEAVCKKFERKLFKWKSEWVFLKSGDKHEFINDVVEALYYHQTIFYNGIIIYYFTVVKEVNDSILESYCTKILENCALLLESVKTKKVQIVPVIWGAFIGACSATEDLQVQFKQWFQDLAESNKFSKYWLSRQIMMEVYRRRDNGENNDNWVSVIKEWGVNLMLV